MPCIACKRELKIVARDLCCACYQRWYKTGSTEYSRWGKHSRCQIDDCENEVVSHGLCDMHRKRLERHGHVEQTRPDSWGAIRKHPLGSVWRHLWRYRGQRPIVPEWSDFLQFIADVGERPHPKDKLFEADDSKPIGPGNFVWKRAITSKVDGEDHRTYLNRVQKVYRSMRQEAFKGYDLKRLYGLSRKKYMALYEAQNGKCAVCGQIETKIIKGRLIKLAVDHCHDSGAIRGLLCSKCNQGLGHLDDSPERLRRAIAYLERERQ